MPNKILSFNHLNDMVAFLLTHTMGDKYINLHLDEQRTVVEGTLATLEGVTVKELEKYLEDVNPKD